MKDLNSLRRLVSLQNDLNYCQNIHSPIRDFPYKYQSVFFGIVLTESNARPLSDNILLFECINELSTHIQKHNIKM